MTNERAANRLRGMIEGHERMLRHVKADYLIDRLRGDILAMEYAIGELETKPKPLASWLTWRPALTLGRLRA